MANKAIVVGGGIIGASTALFLARKGWDVTLLDRGEIGQEASTAAAGILSPPFFLDPGEPDADQNTQPLLSRKGYDFYPDFLDLLSGYDDRDVGYDVSGMWYLAFTEGQVEEKKTMHREMQKYGRDSEWVSGRELRDRMPVVSGDVQGGLFFAEEARVDPGRLVALLRTALVAEDVTLLEGTPVESLEPAASSVTVTTDDGTHGADKLLVSAGCWSARLLEHTGLELPVEPRKGQMLSVKAPDLRAMPPVRSGERFVLPRNKKAILGSTTEDAGFDTEPTAGAMQDLFQSGIEMIPSLEDADFIRAWAGLRPYLDRKGGPYLGRHPDHDHLFVACGHYKTGILQGPFTGRVMADWMAGEDPDLDVSRYGLNR